MSNLTPDVARIAGEQFLKNISQQANVFLDTVIAHEQRMLQAIAKEKENNSALKSLAGSIVHEIRNPLAQIRGTLYLIEQQIHYLNNNPYIQDANKVIQNGFQIIDITMDAMRDKPIDRENFVLLSALDLVEEAVTDYAYEEVAHAKKVSVKGGDFKLMAEPIMVKYVLYNLIQNALWYVKSLPDAQIFISVMLNVDGVNQIEVRDTGPGIAPDTIPKGPVG